MNRTCIACGKTDADPRHMTVLTDNAASAYHLDCHARMGCTVCASQLAAGGDGLTGDALRTFLTEGT